ncbi:hypothetical protein B0H13DRAFT_1909174 [Mycena leptocephala]|nr:hypothetical protein B0H13DRAFT_1909174 [Mycena leptocephala]
MNFALLVAFASVLGLSVTASSVLPTACGPNANILSESSFAHKGAEVKLATISCPGSDVQGRGSLANASKRQVVSQCDAVTNPCMCDLRPEQPSLLDCNNLTIALDGLSDPLLIPPSTGVNATLATCTYIYINLDTVEYSVCGSTFVASPDGSDNSSKGHFEQRHNYALFYHVDHRYRRPLLFSPSSWKRLVLPHVVDLNNLKAGIYIQAKGGK